MAGRSSTLPSQRDTAPAMPARLVFRQWAQRPSEAVWASPVRACSRALFSDPDGNSWVLQEITTRLPGRIDSGVTSFGSASDLASALRRAATAHGEHEKRIGQADPNWPDWYAEYLAAEQAGTELPI